jgi:hypothetical protein
MVEGGPIMVVAMGNLGVTGGLVKPHHVSPHQAKQAVDSASGLGVARDLVERLRTT